MGHTLLSSYVTGVGPGDMGESLAYQGRELRRLESPHDRRYVSVFGELTLYRWVYGTRETQKHEVVPTDALLGLPDRARTSGPSASVALTEANCRQ